jgi:hypothetical protein
MQTPIIVAEVGNMWAERPGDNGFVAKVAATMYLPGIAIRWLTTG